MSVIRPRPTGVLLTEDGMGLNAKIVAVLNRGVDSFHSKMDLIGQLPDFVKSQANFVNIYGWKDVERSKKLIKEVMVFHNHDT